MKKLFSLFKRAWFIFAVIIVLLSLFIIILGDEISIGGFMPLDSPLVQYSLIGIMLIAYIVYWLWRIYRAKSSSGNEATVSAAHLELTELKRQLSTIALQLKRSLKKQRQSRLPCYIMIGPVSSGKSTLIEKAGAPLPLAETDHQKTQSFATLHVREHAVIIEIANRCVEDFNTAENTQEWKNLLALLHRYRRRFDYTAILMTCSLTQVLIADLAWQTSLHKIHSVGKSLIRRLNPSLGAYLIVTEMDRLMGFGAYFAQLTEAERRAAWGFNLSDSDDFTSAYQLLLKNLNDQLLTRLHREQDRSRISLIAGFPLQMASIKSALESTVKNLHQPTPYHEAVTLRGVYFTSNHQQGEQINPLMGVFNTSVTTTAPSVAVLNPLSYFSLDLFGELHTQIASLNQQQFCVKRRRQLLLTSLIGVFSLSVVLILLGHTNYSANKSTIIRVQQLLTGGAVISNQKDRLLWLNEILTDSKTQSTSFGFQYIGFNQSALLYSRLQTMYIAQLQTLLVPMLADLAAKEMQSTQVTSSSRYQALKIYLMLGDPAHAEIGEIQSFTEQHWQAILPKATAIKSLLYTHLNSLLRTGWKTITLDQKLISDTRQQLLKTSPPQLSYIILRYSDLAAQLPGLTLDDASVNHYSQLFQAPASLAGFYTSQGQTFFKTSRQQLADIITHERWVIGNTVIMPQDSLFMQNLMMLYQDDTLQQWQQLFTALRPIQAGDPAGMSIVLHNLIDQSDIAMAVLNELRNRAPQFVFSDGNLSQPGFRMMSKISMQLKAVKNMMQALSRDEDMPAAAYSIAKTLIDKNQDNPIVNLYELANQQAAPMRNWLAYIAEHCAMAIYAQTRVYLNTEWKTQVYDQYANNLNPYYPLNQNASIEIAPSDFAAFFGPEGTLDSFIQTYLAPFIVRSDGNWQLKVSQHTDLSLSPASLMTLQKADAVKIAFFNQQQLGTQFNIAPFALDSRIEVAQLNIGSQNIIDRHDPHLMSPLVWSPAAKPNLATLSMTDRQGHRVGIVAQGSWALLRFMDHCQRRTDSSGNILLSCSVDGYKITYRIQTSSKTNPFSLDITSLHLPAEL